MNVNTNSILSDHVEFDSDQPTCFVTWGGEGMYQLRVGPLIRRGSTTIRFDLHDIGTNSMTPLSMVAEADGLYHWRGKAGAHIWAVLTETKTHVTLTGNYLNEDRTQGIAIIVWPMEDVRVLTSVATPEFLASQRPVRRTPPDSVILGDGFAMRHVAEPSAKGVKVDNMRFVSPPPVEDKNCPCGKPIMVVVAVMTLRGDFLSTEPLCTDCFRARQTG